MQRDNSNAAAKPVQETTSCRVGDQCADVWMFDH